MKSVLFNGSPRGRKSNTAILLEQFQQGYGAEPPQQLFIYRDGEDTLKEAFRETETIILAFPLYTDLMPGKVKQFMESIDPADWRGKRFGVIVQSGFPEALQSSFIVHYFQRLITKREGIYIGGLIRGGVEGIQMMPEKMTRKLRNSFFKLGANFRDAGRVDGPVAESLKRPWKLGPMQRLFFQFSRLIGLSNFYWNHHLKANNVFQERFAAPYGRAASDTQKQQVT